MTVRSHSTEGHEAAAILDAPAFTVCVCTRNRPDDLAGCLAAIERSEIPVLRVIVSDDSDDVSANEELCRQFERVTHVVGPKLGLCANRNNALLHAEGSHVLFLDDDARLAPDFLTRAAERLANADPAERRHMLLTGRERRNGERITFARDQNFLGFQEREYSEADAQKTVVINAAVFPLGLFAEVGFDSSLRYGYDEVDLTTRAVAVGFEIVSIPEAINDHFPSPANRDEYKPVVDASRLYVTLRRYIATDGRPLKALAYAFVAPAHLFAAGIKRDGFAGLVASLRTLRLAGEYILAGRGGRTASAPLRPR